MLDSVEIFESYGIECAADVVRNGGLVSPAMKETMATFLAALKEKKDVDLGEPNLYYGVSGDVEYDQDEYVGDEAAADDEYETNEEIEGDEQDDCGDED